MSEPVIVAEKLSKSYLIGHRARSGSYTLRDVLSREARSVARKAADFVTGRQIVQGDAVEEFWALKSVSFEVRQGEVLGIIGRNGAGKSTLLKILSRITEPTDGRAVLRGRVASLLEVGTGFHGELTGRENIYLNGAILGMSKAEINSKFDEIVAFAEVEQFLDTPVKHYSSGMYVRLAFSVAAHLEPEILIVDEVLAVGDTNFQKKCIGKMRSVSREGRTILLVSHQLGSLADLCSSGIILNQGKVLQHGGIEAAIKSYLESSISSDDSIKESKHVDSVQFDGRSERKAYVFFGEPIVLKAKLKSLPPFPTGFTITIKNSSGRRVSYFATDPNDGVPLPRTEQVEITFRLDFCAYAPGDYFVDVAVTEPRIRNIEEIFAALRFEVLEAPRGGTEAYSAIRADFFPPHEWEVA